ncbi:MAG: Gfo/Idh/MocA family oxidoreductase [Cyclobacteriaceae bacterium]
MGIHNKLNWGILSTAKIGVQKVIPAIQSSQYGTVVAIASRTLSSAKKVARDLGIGRAYGTYEELLHDKSVDAVYIPLPNHMHVEWSKKCLEAGKHVLCEKPIGLNAEEAIDLVNYSKQFSSLRTMEAFMYRFHPQWIKVKQWIDHGKIGELKTIHSFFSYFNNDPVNIRNMKDIGGGGLMDIGCYNISLSRLLFGGLPNRVVGLMEHDEQFEVDVLTSGILEFNKGTSTFTCSTQLSPYQRMIAYGTTGHIEVKIPFNAPRDSNCLLELTDQDGTQQVQIPIADQYSEQVDAFAKAVFGRKGVPTSLEDAVDNMKVIDALNESSKSNKWIELN